MPTWMLVMGLWFLAIAAVCVVGWLVGDVKRERQWRQEARDRHPAGKRINGTRKWE